MLKSGQDDVVETDLRGSVCEAPAGIPGDTLGFYVGGRISHEFSPDCALTLDFEGMRLILQ
jgi:hypothetical protein